MSIYSGMGNTRTANSSWAALGITGVFKHTFTDPLVPDKLHDVASHMAVQAGARLAHCCLLQTSGHS